MTNENENSLPSQLSLGVEVYADELALRRRKERKVKQINLISFRYSDLLAHILLRL